MNIKQSKQFLIISFFIVLCFTQATILQASSCNMELLREFRDISREFRNAPKVIQRLILQLADKCFHVKDPNQTTEIKKRQYQPPLFIFTFSNNALIPPLHVCNEENTTLLSRWKYGWDEKTEDVINNNNLRTSISTFTHLDNNNQKIIIRKYYKKSSHWFYNVEVVHKNYERMLEYLLTD